jgi:hypothetical protein
MPAMKAAMTFKQLILFTLLIFLGIQFIPVERTNPPIKGRSVGPQPVMDLFRRSCFDCHSNETVWPWYGKVAPLSWLVAQDVNHGRDKLNFSTWNRLSLKDQDRLTAEIWKKVKSGDMPPPMYVFGNQEGRVTTDHHKMLRDWCGVPPN